MKKEHAHWLIKLFLWFTYYDNRKRNNDRKIIKQMLIHWFIYLFLGFIMRRQEKCFLFLRTCTNQIDLCLDALCFTYLLPDMTYKSRQVCCTVSCHLHQVTSLCWIYSTKPATYSTKPTIYPTNPTIYSTKPTIYSTKPTMYST
jgi:hypothetical protein